MYYMLHHTERQSEGGKTANMFLVDREFLSSVHGLGLKSVECIRLLALHHNAFPVRVQLIFFSRLISCRGKLFLLLRTLSKWSGCACHELHGYSHDVNICIICGAGGYKCGTYLCEARLGSVRTTT
jgi:hypothetical protein